VAHPLLFPPGTAFSYSNTNYVVAGLLIERVTGTSIVRQLERRLIRLLGDDKDARVVANLHPAPDALYTAFFNALVALFCDMTPTQAAAAARAHPDRATAIRFR
jgi:D-alanyl-D-alanine carboxypeptidase